MFINFNTFFSPPHGSPKPAIRSRKHNKSTAPNPPGMPSKDKDDGKGSGSEKSGNRESKDLSKSAEKSKEKCSKEKEKVDEKQEKKDSRPPPPKETGKSSLKEDSTKKQDVKAVEIKSVGSERRSSRESERRDSKEGDSKVSGEMSSLEFTQFESAKGSGIDLNRRTSKSGEDVRKMKVEDGGYCTLRKPPRPMPRTVLGDAVNEKPAVPERPPQLQRPLSFRIPKSPDSLIDVSLNFFYALMSILNICQILFYFNMRYSVTRFFIFYCLHLLSQAVVTINFFIL